MYEDSLSSKEKEVFEALKNVIDPELGVSLVDLGLIYPVKLMIKMFVILIGL